MLPSLRDGPVYIGYPLLTFLTSEPERFGVIDPEFVMSSLLAGDYPEIHYLINSLPLLKQGYALMQSLRLLFDIYSRINLQFGSNGIYPDTYMNEIFGGTIPVTYYKYSL